MRPVMDILKGDAVFSAAAAAVLCLETPDRDRIRAANDWARSRRTKPNADATGVDHAEVDPGFPNTFGIRRQHSRRAKRGLNMVAETTPTMETAEPNPRSLESSALSSSPRRFARRIARFVSPGLKNATDAVVAQ